MTKLRPMPVNSNQIKRITRCPVGSGFFVYHYSHNDDESDTVEVVEFMLSPNGDVLKPDGTPLEYCTQDGKDSPVMRYRWVREQVKE